MKEEIKQLILYRMERAKEAITEGNCFFQKAIYVLPLIGYIMPVSTLFLLFSLQRVTRQPNIQVSVRFSTKRS